MSEKQSMRSDSAPGDDETATDLRGYVIGLAMAVVLTAASFWAAGTGLIWGPGIPIALGVLAVAQMGVHLVFFDRPGQHEQCTGTRLRHLGRGPSGRRIAMDHGQPEPQHAADGPADADAEIASTDVSAGVSHHEAPLVAAGST